MEQTECSEASAYTIQTPGYHPKKAYNTVNIVSHFCCVRVCVRARARARVCVCVWISMRFCCSQSLLQLFVSRLIDNRQERCCIAQPTFCDCAAILQTINTSTQSINKYRTHSNSVSNQRENNDKIHRSTCQCTRDKEGKEKGKEVIAKKERKKETKKGRKKGRKKERERERKKKERKKEREKERKKERKDRSGRGLQKVRTKSFLKQHI